MKTNYAQSVDHLVNSMKQTTGNPPYSNDKNEYEIELDPLIHKVIYNPELNEYKVVKR